MLVVEKGCCFCQELLCFEPSEDFSGLSPSRSMLSDWCHWKQSLWMCLVHRSRSPGATGNNAPQAWLFQAQGLFLLVEEAGCGLVAGFRHYLNLLVFEGSFPHLVVHELVLLEHAQLHLRLDTHDLRDTTWGISKQVKKPFQVKNPFLRVLGHLFQVSQKQDQGWLDTDRIYFLSPGCLWAMKVKKTSVLPAPSSSAGKLHAPKHPWIHHEQSFMVLHCGIGSEGILGNVFTPVSFVNLL